MPRFHFEIIDGVKVPDPVGTVCRSQAQAKELATAIATQIAIDLGTGAARKVVVLDEDGSKIHEAPVEEPDVT